MNKMTKKSVSFLFLLGLVLFSAKVLLAADLESQKNKQVKVLKSMEVAEKEAFKAPIASARLNLKYVSQDFRDPFLSQAPKIASDKDADVKTNVPLPKFNVQGLVWGGVMPQAIIDNKVYKIGDVVDGARITDISSEGVKVFLNKTEYTVSAPALTVASGSNNTQGGRQ